ncbi:MAG: DUF4150 domain-containing protein [Mesorhizobium sp.]|uniref:PAAR-like domain-containing protein n=1 Tax=Mesorhizobium sp. TaxID=1871066 RepID=UPI000FE6620B|nr:PAAR-like domain-containing protein [Mesorhizobium sp.]RWP37397.1 MAG: DUF4150 domain-containing protein [Mesorhizobium sp.]
MTKNVFAGTWEIAAENGMNKSIARFPDVCMSPPSPPAGPIPIPYPNTSFSNNLKSGSTTVRIGGKGAALAQKSYYKESVLGNEAATRTFGAAIITHQVTGKTFFSSWCMDVKFEGKNVCRHLDMTTSNHASYPGSTPPLNTAEAENRAAALARMADPKPKCPCCGKEGGQCPAALPTTMSDDPSKPPVAREALAFEEFYRLDEKDASGALTQTAKDRSAALAANKCTGGSCPNAGKSPPKSAAPCDVYRVTTLDESDAITANSAVPKETLREAHGIPAAKGAFKAAFKAGKSLLGVDQAKWNTLTLQEQNESVKLDHTTPRTAGGCPASKDNTAPYVSKCANCKKADKDLDNWSNQELTTRRAALGLKVSR